MESVLNKPVTMRRVEPEEAQVGWETTWKLVGTSLANPTDALGASILQQIMEGRVGLWAIERGNELKALLIVTIQFHAITDTMSLLIFAGFAHKSIVEDEWLVGYDKLCEFCRAHDLNAITFYTRNPVLVRAMRKFNAITETHVVVPVLQGGLTNG